MVAVKNCEPGLPYIFADLFSKSCFPDCWKVSSVVPVFRNFEERYTAENCRLVCLPSVVSKFFEKLINKRLIGHL